MIDTNEIGVACCGNCGAELEVACTAGCSDPDVELREHAVASLRVPDTCNYRKCREPVAPRAQAHGRPPSKCVRHLAQGRRWTANLAAKRAAK